MNTVWSILADATVVLHYAFLAYVVVGGFIAWRWPRTIVLHALTALWAILIVTVKLECPLTFAQNTFRHREGLASVPGGFIDTYVRGTLYPSNLERLSQIVVGVVVLVSWTGFALLQRRRHDRSLVVTGQHA